MTNSNRSTPRIHSMIFRFAIAPIICATISLAAPALGASKPKPPPLPEVGDVLLAGGIAPGGGATSSAEFYSVAKHKFFVTGSMSAARAGHQMNWMPPSPERTADSAVVLGGFTGSAAITGTSSISYNMNVLASVEIYNPTTGAFAVDQEVDGSTMTNGRALFASVAFPGDLSTDFLQGHVLMIGGLWNAGDLNSCRTANILHPDDDAVTSTSNPKIGVMMQTLTNLADGNVLMAGGIDDFAGDITNTAELFTPPNEFFTTLGAPLNVARAGHTATLLKDGTVLLAGGIENVSGVMTAVNSAELYDPIAQTFSAVAATMTAARVGHTATLLKDGRVLLAGGHNGTSTFSVTGASDGDTLSWSDQTGSILNTAEIYDPATKTFEPVGGIVKKTGLPKAAMKAARVNHTATLLSNGKVLLTGGFGPDQSGAIQELNSGELFTPNSNKKTLGTFAKTSSMISGRALHTAALAGP